MELQTGKPFQGPAGKVLDEILGRVGIPRNEISIGNLICCQDTAREKKNPTAEEIDRCADRLRIDIALANPRVLVLLGNLPMAQFFPGVSTISKVRGMPRVWNDRLALATFHPARALPNRNPEAKELIYEDLMTARSLL